MALQPASPAECAPWFESPPVVLCRSSSRRSTTLVLSSQQAVPESIGPISLARIAGGMLDLPVPEVRAQVQAAIFAPPLSSTDPHSASLARKRLQPNRGRSISSFASYQQSPLPSEMFIAPPQSPRKNIASRKWHRHFREAKNFSGRHGYKQSRPYGTAINLT